MLIAVTFTIRQVAKSDTSRIWYTSSLCYPTAGVVSSLVYHTFGRVLSLAYSTIVRLLTLVYPSLAWHPSFSPMVGCQRSVITSGRGSASLSLKITEKSRYEQPACRPWRRLWKAFIYKTMRPISGLHRVVGLFNKSCLQPNSAHLGGHTRR